MNFQEFLAVKRATAIVEHLETLDESEAAELLEQLDDATIELIEALLDEVTAGTLKKKRAAHDRGEITTQAKNAVENEYKTRKRANPIARYPEGGMHPDEHRATRKDRDREARYRNDNFSSMSREGESEWRTPEMAKAMSPKYSIMARLGGYRDMYGSEATQKLAKITDKYKK